MPGGGAVSNNPEKKLQEFLATLPLFRRKELEQGISSLSEGEMNEWRKYEQEKAGIFAAECREYERLLRPFPASLREYRKRTRKEWGPFAPLFMSAIKRGRPRLDDVVERVEQLRKKEGLSRAKAVMRVNQERTSNGLPPSTAERVRGLVKYRKRESRNSDSRPGKN
jgi:hypothetical protein